MKISNLRYGSPLEIATLRRPHSAALIVLAGGILALIAGWVAMDRILGGWKP